MSYVRIAAFPTASTALGLSYISTTAALAVLGTIATVGLVIAARSRWVHRRTDRRLGVA